MEPDIASRFNDTILRAAMQRYDSVPGQIKLLDGFESFIRKTSRLPVCSGLF